MITVIIVNWNSGVHLQKCLKSLFDSNNEHINKVLIIDNNSTDQSLDNVIATDSRIKIINQPINYGFSKACNLGFEYVDTKYVLFLNPDVIVNKNTINKLHYIMDENNELGICGPQLHSINKIIQKTCSRVPTTLSFCIHLLKLDSIFKKYGYKMLEWDHSSTRYVSHIIGAFYFVRSDLYRELNGFDETFFMYMEDLDFSIRASCSGYKILYCADADAQHIGCVSSNKLPHKRYQINMTSKIAFAKKHFKHSSYLIVLTSFLFQPIIIIISNIVTNTYSQIISQLFQLYSLTKKAIINK